MRTVLDTLFGMSLTDICCGKVTQLSADDTTRLEKIMQRLEKWEPVQYVLGEEWFCGHRFGVAPGVLIPRPETQGLVAWACHTAREQTARKATPQTIATPQDAGAAPQDISSAPQGDSDITVLDIGTGSGCIAISMALDLPEAAVTAWDISADALSIARSNAARLGAEVTFCREDALNPPCHSSRWDVIVSNPPYICNRERTDMAENVLRYEPETALFVPDSDPLLFYRSIARYAAKALKPGGALLFETNTAYAHDVAHVMEQEGLAHAEVRDDCFGKPRMVKATIYLSNKKI